MFLLFYLFFYSKSQKHWAELFLVLIHKSSCAKFLKSLDWKMNFFISSQLVSVNKPCSRRLLIYNVCLIEFVVNSVGINY